MGYRDRQEARGRQSKEPNSSAMWWGLVAITFANLGPLLGRVLERRDFHASAEALTLGTIAIGAACLVGGLIAYREARRSVARHVAELKGDLPSDEGSRHQ